MKKYIHWLKIDGFASDNDIKRQYKEIKAYLDKYPNASVEVYKYSGMWFNRAIKLTCEQNYQDLDMMVNSMSHNLRVLKNKPKNLIDKEDFLHVPEYAKEKEMSKKVSI